MNEIRPNLNSSTLSHVAMAGLFSMAALNAMAAASASDVQRFSHATYLATGSSATFDSFRGGVSGQYDHTSIPFEQAIGNFYSRLLLSQEPLGVEFEKVLHENLWDLYES